MSSHLTEIQNKKTAKPPLESLSRRHLQKALAQTNIQNETVSKSENAKSSSNCIVKHLKEQLKSQQKEELTLSSEETVKNINDAIQHKKMLCKECNSHELLLLIGCFHFEMFRKKYRKFQAIVIKEDERLEAKRKADKEREEQKEKKVKTEDEKLLSKLNIQSYPTLTNVKQFDKLLEFARRSIDTFTKLTDNLIDLQRPFLLEIGVADVLRSLVYIFDSYCDLSYHYKSASFYKAFMLTTGLLLRSHLFHSYYSMARLHLNVGLLDEAQMYLETANKHTDQTMQNEISLASLIQIELDLMANKKLSESASKLKTLIKKIDNNSLTISKVYLKCSAFYLATKFHPKYFEFDSSFEEFVSSMNHLAQMIGLYHPRLFDSNCENPIVSCVLKNIWIRFASYKLLFQLFNTYYLFCKNMCLVFDYQVFYFNTVLSIARINCMTFWVVNLLVRTSLHDSILLQKEKLQNAYLVLGGSNKTFQRRWMHLDANAAKEDVNKVSKILNGSPMRPPVLDLEEDSLRTDYEAIPFVQQRLFMINRHELDKDVDDSTFKIVLMDKDVESLEECNLYDLQLLRFELIHYLNAIENEGKQQFEYLKSIDLNQQLANHLKAVSSVFGSKGEKIKSFFPNMFSTAMQLYFRKFQLEHLDDADETLKAVSQIVFESHLYCKSYELFCLLRHFVQKYIEVYCNKHLFSNDHLLTFDLSAIEQKLIGFSKEQLSSSPPPVRKTRKGQAMAPKKTVRYQMNEFEEYVEELYKKTRSARSTVPQVFEVDDSSDEDTNEANEIQIVEEPKTAKKTRSSSRIARSQNLNVEKDENELNENKSKKVPKTAQKKTRSKGTLQLKQDETITQLDLISDCFGKLHLDENESLLDKHLHFFTSKERNQTHEEFIDQMLLDLMKMFGYIPPIDTFNFVYKIKFRLSISKDYEDQLYNMAYYLTEMTSGSSLRYQTKLTQTQRIKAGVKTFDMKYLEYNKNEKFFDHNFTDFVNLIPVGWRFVQLQQVKQPNQMIPDLYICRLEANTLPIVIRIKGNSSKYTKDFVDELKEILTLNGSTIKEVDLKTYWNCRFALDKRLENLIKTVESVWIGPFIGIFMGKCNDTYFYTVVNKLKQFCIDSWANEAKIDEKGSLCSLLGLFCESFPFLNKEKFIQAMVFLFEKCDSRFESWFEKGEALFADYFKRRCISKTDFGEKVKFSSVSLVVSSSLNQFPFEVMPSLMAIKQDIFRMPSLRYLIWIFRNQRKTTLALSSGFNDDKTFFLIDPDQDLQRTYDCFKLKCERMIEKHQWKGYLRQEPNVNDFKKHFDSNHFYIYFGHNSGNQFYQNFEKTNVNCLAIVLGCSSGKLYAHSGPLDVTGTPYKFLINGCPSYVGCLWEVTDVDIDRFADKLLHHVSHNWDENSEHPKVKNVCQGVRLSRSICKLKYLNGAATVVHGLPVFFEKFALNKQKKSD